MWNDVKFQLGSDNRVGVLSLTGEDLRRFKSLTLRGYVLDGCRLHRVYVSRAEALEDLRDMGVHSI